VSMINKSYMERKSMDIMKIEIKIEYSSYQ
jgi:hypothetical protein